MCLLVYTLSFVVLKDERLLACFLHFKFNIHRMNYVFFDGILELINSFDVVDG